jgi:hypothetical protein
MLEFSMITEREADIPVLTVPSVGPIVKRYRFQGSDDESQPFGRRLVTTQEAALRRKTMTVHASNLVHQEYTKQHFTV